ncbi:unnamed protein product [Paramecium sonneborni]|uniref:Uncharacterized protein n=1 Tax=Paramecium sonneborni TaxID=65129 RepID=A0A8S1MYW6_9CILI|nr:unnamed protein product [Paramecium sonneborni]
MNDNNHETFFFNRAQKRRIHEQDYALKVISHTKVDKETIQLSESLFNAKITAKQSSCIIRDIQRSVQQKIKFYDEYLKSSDSFRKQTDRKSLSPEIIKPYVIQTQQQSKNQLISEQKNTDLPSPIKNNQQLIQTPKKSPNQQQQSRKSLKQNTQSTSPNKKQANSQKKKKITNNFPPQIKQKSNSQYIHQKERQSCYLKLQVKESQKDKEDIFNTNRPQTARVAAISEKNEEQKKNLKNTMDNKLKKKQQQKEMVDTQKPKINNQRNSKKFKKSASKEFQTEIKDLMHLIDNQNQVKSKQ